jgi:transposase-like protein
MGLLIQGHRLPLKLQAVHQIGSTPISDKAGSYPPSLAVTLPGVLHRTGRYRTNGIERDHGFLKERLRPMRGLKSVVSAATFAGSCQPW